MTTSTAAAPSTTRPASSTGWRVHISADAILAAAKELSPRVIRILLVLETMWRLKPYCWPSQEKLAEALGISVDTVPDVLRTARAEGIIHVVMDRARKGQVVNRVGIIALRRLSEGPVATPETLASIEAQMRSEQEARSRSYKLKPTPLLDRQNHPPSVSDFAEDRLAISLTHLNKDETEKKDEADDDEFARKAPAPESSSSGADFGKGNQDQPNRPTPKTPCKPLEPSAADAALVPATIAVGIVAKLLSRFQAKMAAAPDRPEVDAWIAEHDVELVQVAAEMIERGKLRLRRGIAAFLTTHHGRDPDWVRKDAGLPPPAGAAPMLQNYNPPAPKEPPAEPETREELQETLDRLNQAEARPRRLEWWERDLRETTRAKLDALDAAEGGVA